MEVSPAGGKVYFCSRLLEAEMEAFQFPQHFDSQTAQKGPLETAGEVGNAIFVFLFRPRLQRYPAAYFFF